MAEQFGLSVYTIHYYDKQGLLPFVGKNSSGYREFTDSDLGLIHTICCLKETGMAIRDIRRYIDFCMTGAETVDVRHELLKAQREQVLNNINRLTESLKEIDRKIDIYSAPDAKKNIDLQRKLSSEEKKMHRLYDSYETKEPAVR